MTGKVIGIVGYLGSGKTTMASAAINFVNNFTRVGFADPLYDMLIAMGLPETDVRDKSKWNDPQELLFGRSIRHACVTLGTEWGRKQINVDVWSAVLVNRIRPILEMQTHVIIDNVRFPSEMDYLIANCETEFVALYRDDIEIDLSHESEKHIAYLQRFCKYHINNVTITGAVEEFCKILEKIDRA